MFLFSGSTWRDRAPWSTGKSRSTGAYESSSLILTHCVNVLLLHICTTTVHLQLHRHMLSLIHGYSFLFKNFCYLKTSITYFTSGVFALSGFGTVILLSVIHTVQHPFTIQMNATNIYKKHKGFLRFHITTTGRLLPVL